MNAKEKKKATIGARRLKDKTALLENLKSIPIIEVACSKASIGRATYYRWRNEDETFSKDADEAIAEGEKRINDLSESQLISLIKDRSMPGIAFWLRAHHSKYATKVQFEGSIQTDKSLTPEQEELIKKALTHSGLTEESYESGNITDNPSSPK